MKTIWRSLLWKEFREHRWVAVSLTAIILAVPLYATAMNLLDRDFHYDPIGETLALLAYPAVAGVFLGMRAAAGERASHSDKFIASLPVRWQSVGLVRLAVAIITAIVPIAAVALMGISARTVLPVSPLNRVAEFGIHPIAYFLIGSACTIHILLVVAAFGIGQRTEVLAAVRGLTVLAVWGLGGLLARILIGVNWLWLILAFGPPYYWIDSIEKGDTWRLRYSVLIWAGVVSLLGFCFMRRYNRAFQPIESTLNERRRWIELGPPSLNHPLGALLWKTSREASGYGVKMLGLSIVGSLMIGLGIAQAEGSIGEFPTHTFTVLTIALGAAGFVLALLLGVGTFIADLQTNVNVFWRSRPISASQWYWTKYGIGAATLLIATIGPMYASDLGRRASRGASSGFDDIVSVFVFMLAVYSFAATAVCLVRHTLYAAILGTGFAAALGLMLMMLLSFENTSETWIGVTVGFVLIASTLIGWWAAVKDYSV